MVIRLSNQAKSPDDQKRLRRLVFLVVIFATLLPILMMLGIFAFVFGGIYLGSKSTEEFKCAMTEINKNKEAVQILGTPIRDGYFIMPNIEISDSRRVVYFDVSVTGTRNSGNLSVDSYRDNFRSNFLMELEVDGVKKELYRGSFPCRNN